MNPKPSHLGRKYAEQFKDTSIAEVYHHRPPYSDEAIRTLIELITDEPRAILDVGCGTGDLARRLVGYVEQVDAIDFSRAMLHKGRTLPGGDHPHLHWTYGHVEEVEFHPPYALITAGESLHWMQWHIVLPLFRRALTPHGYLALVGRESEHNPWDENLNRLIARFSTNREYRPYNLVEELEHRHLFQQQGSIRTDPVPFVQSGEAYIHAIHSRNGFSRDRMDKEVARIFDEALRKTIAPFLHEGLLRQSVSSSVVWGTPQEQ